MKSLSIAILFTLAFASSTFAQTFGETLVKVRQIKLLQSTRDDVKTILRGYENHEDDPVDWHYQTFWNEDLSIEVTYSSGTCADNSKEEDASLVWNVKEWIVTKVEVDLKEPQTLGHAGLNLAAYKKEPRYGKGADSFVFHDKTSGFAVKTWEDGIQELVFFPPRSASNKLCRESSAAKAFYTRKGWFSQAKPDDNPICLNGIANVTDLNLSAVEIDGTSNPSISVVTVAADPENDILTYDYKVSAGRIVGKGANVIWDLTDVPPGTYTIRAGVDDGAGVVGKTVTKTVVVK